MGWSIRPLGWPTWWRVAFLGLGWTVLAAVVMCSRIQPPDDMFITFRYAWNLVHGQGFVFNPGERVFGLTNPGLGLALALLGGLTRIPIHILGPVVFALGLVTTALFLWRDARDRAGRVEAVLAGTLLVTSAAIWIADGSASSSVLALLAGSALLVHRRPATAGLLAGLAVWFRPDAVLGVAALGLLAWVERRRPPWRWGLVAAGVVLAGATAAWIYFGSPIPNTLIAKRIAATVNPASSVGAERFWARALPVFRRRIGPLWLLSTALGVAGQWPLYARGGRATRTLVLYGTGIAVIYPLLGVPFYHWYVVPPLAMLLYGLVALASGVGREMACALHEAWPGRASPARRFQPALAVVLAAAILAAPAWSEVAASVQTYQASVPGGRFDTYRRAGLWIRAHSRPGDRIAYGEIGNLAYWSRRPVDDLMGLVTPRNLPYLVTGDGLGAFLSDPPEFFVYHPKGPQRGLVESPWFRSGYLPVARIPDPEGTEAATIYRKRPGARLPPPRPPREPKRVQQGGEEGGGP